MKLLTHNMLACPIKGVKEGYPFAIEATEVATKEVEYDPDFLRHIFPRVEYDALRAASESLGRKEQEKAQRTGRKAKMAVWKEFDGAHRAKNDKNPLAGFAELPAAVPEGALEDDEFLQAFHHALLELHLEEGALICPETGRRFTVNKGIPNLLLHEDEC